MVLNLSLVDDREGEGGGWMYKRHTRYFFVTPKPFELSNSLSIILTEIKWTFDTFKKVN